MRISTGGLSGLFLHDQFLIILVRLAWGSSASIVLGLQERQLVSVVVPG